ncbi:hypothetical protein I4F81_006384 [Pyropia yezoensis]|uniref:Uncharacterized protein n=1 Tax=Pyropia yezoensis TaxID=2788 RepID=A0ACC3C124_PYRYE|nr:hypothetical protein I4F81_006384 [Neopyropia yezoensis]
MAFRGVRQRRPRRPVMHPPRYPTAAASSSGVTLAGAPSPPPASAAAPTSPLSGTLRAAMLGVPAGMRLALAGGLSGAAVHTALHPLDTLKTRALHARFLRPSEPGAPTRRLALNCLSAAAGNVASSVLFVPKEVIKQRLQTGLSPSVPAAVASLVAGGGVRALYRGYGVTLARNIPSAVLKFSLYEEAKVALRRRKATAAADAAAVVGPGEATVRSRLRWSGLDHPRMVWSALFTAMGFGTYEAFKRLLVPEGVVAEVGGDTSPTVLGEGAPGDYSDKWY